MSKDWLPYPGALELAKYFDWDERSEQVREVSELCREAYGQGFKDRWPDDSVDPPAPTRNAEKDCPKCGRPTPHQTAECRAWVLAAQAQDAGDKDE